MVDDQIKVTHDNNGRFYRIKMDLAKEGSEIWDLTPYFKGRVGDNRFGLQVVWTYQGRLLDTTGMKPYIEGLVGQYSFGKNGEIDMDPDAVPVRYDGSPDDCEEAGKATFYFPSQMFPKEGIFKGFIGVKDDRDGSKNPQISGVTIWFKVLPGIAQMGHACDAYVDELDKALQNFKDKLDNHDKDYQARLQNVIDEARNTYESETKNAHDSLDALKSQIQANRDEQQNLTQHLAETEQQISEHDVVTVSEFNKLDSKITDRLAKMDLTPHLYATQQDMQEKNPQGTSSLCITADTNHKWIFDYDSNQWIDAGPYTFALLDQGQKDLLATNPNNLLPDPDFKSNNTDYWFEAHADKAGIFNIDTSNSIDGSNIASITEVGSAGAWIQTNLLPVGNHKNYSFRCYLNCRHTQIPAYFAVIFSNKDKVDLAYQSINLQDQANDDFMVFNFNQVVPVGSMYFRVAFVLPKGGTIKIYKPQMVWGNEIKPYQANYYAASTNPDNLVPDPDFRLDYQMWIPGGNKVLPRSWIDKENKINGSNAMTLQAVGKGGCFVMTPNYRIAKSENVVSMSAYIKTNSINDTAGFSVVFCDDSNKILEISGMSITENYSDYHLITSNGIAIPQNATQFRFQIFLNDLGTVSISRPIVNYGNYALSYSYAELFNKFKHKLFKTNTDNIISNSDFNLGLDFWEIGSNGELPTYEFDDENSINNYRLIVVKGNEPKGFWINSAAYPVGQHTQLKFSAVSKVIRNTKANDQAYLSVVFDDSQARLLSASQIPIIENQELFKLESSVIPVPANASTVRITLTGFNDDILYMSKPKISFCPNFESQKDNESLPQLSINTDPDKIGNNYITAPFNYKNGGEKITGYMQISVQGDSSRSFPKKNYKIKLYKDKELKEELKIKPESSWNANNKFNLKANWVDATQSRNLINAKLFKEAISVTPFESEVVAEKLSKAQAFGQMEGFPIEINMSDGYHGLYTFNTKKDDKTFGMDKDIPGEEAIEFEKPNSQLNQKSDPLDGNLYGTIVQDKPTPELITNFNNFLNFINSSSDEELKTNLHNYIDVHSVITTYLWGILAVVWDTSGKSNLLLTYDNGKYFYMIPYDMDSTWGLLFDGSIHSTFKEYDFKNIGNESIMQFVTEESQMKIFNIIYRLFKKEMVEQYSKLRNTVWSNSNLIDEYKKFIDSIPQDAYEREHNRWPNIPSINENNFAQIQSAIIQRGSQMDKWINELLPKIDPLQEIKTRINNLEQNKITQN